jgi:DNA-binding NarL/FixJ family response regulator
VTSSSAAIRVLIVDDHALIREGIASLLDGNDDITVVGSAGDAAEALERCGELGAEVVLMDLSMPGIDSASATATATALLRKRYPQVEVVVLTGYGNDLSVRLAIQAGASACLLKTVGGDELADAIRGVTQGRSTFSSELLPHLLSDPTDAAATHLTPRERDILHLLASGRTNKGIAQELGLTPGTVRVYVSAILAKLGVTNRTEATVVAIRDGLIGESVLQPGPADDHR